MGYRGCRTGALVHEYLPGCYCGNCNSLDYISEAVVSTIHTPKTVDWSVFASRVKLSQDRYYSPSSHLERWFEDVSCGFCSYLET